MHFDFEKDIILESDELLLKPLSLTDAINLLPIVLAYPSLLQYSPKQIHSEVLLKEYVTQAIIHRLKKLRYSFSIYQKTEKCFVGSTAFLNVSEGDDRLEIGATWLDKKFQGTGLNRKCKYLLLEYAFDTLKSHRVEFRTDERNMQSRKAIEKINAKFEGVLREHTLMSDGFRRNTFCYSILQSEWETMKLNFLSTSRMDF